jgi:predicted DNA repair protein MutK
MQEEDTTFSCFDSDKMQAFALRTLEKLSFFLQWKYLCLLQLVLISFVTRHILGLMDKYDDFQHMKSQKSSEMAHTIHRYLQKFQEMEDVTREHELDGKIIMYSANHNYLQSLFK